MAARRWSVNRQDLGTVLGSSKDFLGLGLGLGPLPVVGVLRLLQCEKRPCPYKSVDPMEFAIHHSGELLV